MPKTQDANVMHKKDREETHRKIRQAIIRIEKGRPKVVKEDRKMSVASVAEEAGVSRALIHKLYPDLLSRIRGNVNKDIQAQRDEKNQALKKEREKNRELREKIVQLTCQNNTLSSINATLVNENEELKAIAESKNVAVFKTKKD
jgi:AcrR family transcriptional regulator